MSEDRVSPAERRDRIQRAAVRFANDYGPLPVANRGDADATHEVATRFYKILRDEGLDIITRERADWPQSS